MAKQNISCRSRIKTLKTTYIQNRSCMISRTMYTIATNGHTPRRVHHVHTQTRGLANYSMHKDPSTDEDTAAHTSSAQWISKGSKTSGEEMRDTSFCPHNRQKCKTGSSQETAHQLVYATRNSTRNAHRMKSHRAHFKLVTGAR